MKNIIEKIKLMIWVIKHNKFECILKTIYDFLTILKDMTLR